MSLLGTSETSHGYEQAIRDMEIGSERENQGREVVKEDGKNDFEGDMTWLEKCQNITQRRQKR